MGLFWTILAGIVILCGIAVLVKGKVELVKEKGTQYRPEVVETIPLRSLGLLILALGLGTLFLNCFTIVGAKNVGVVVAFGRPTGTVTNGWNWVAPWSSIETFDATRQALKLTGGGDDNGDPIQVRLANNTMATVEVSGEWEIDDSVGITDMYRDYRTFDNVTNNVVRRRLSAALNSVFEKYDPLLSLKGEKQTVTMGDLEEATKLKLQSILPKGVKIVTLYLPKIVYTDEVQAQINQYISAVNDTKIAQQQLLTATARKEASAKLAEGDLTAGVLYQNCLDLVERLMKDGKALPAAFNCGTSPVTVVPVK